MAHVRVTGASGFLGSHIAEAAEAAGHEVDAPGRSTPRVDLTDGAAVEGWLAPGPADVLIHAAWYAGDDRIASDENSAWVDSTRELLDTFVEAGGRRVITLGTCFEYELGTPRLFEDSTPIRPHTPYGRAKAAVGEMVSRLTPPVVGIHARLGYVYGPGERPPRLVPALVATLLAGERFASTSGTQRRDYLYVTDVADALVRLIDADVAGPVNVGSGEAVPVAALISAVAEELDATDRVDLGALPQRPGDPEVVELDVAKLAALGWRPAVDLREGARRTVRSMRSPTGEAPPP